METIRMPATSRLLTRAEAAAYLGVQKHTLASWACKSGKGPAYVKVGRLVKYRQTDLDAYLDDQTVVRAKV